MMNCEIRGIGGKCSTHRAQENRNQTESHLERAKIISFAKFLGTNLPEELYANQRMQLFKIAEDSSSLTLTESLIHKIRDDFVGILKELSNPSIKDLKTSSKNHPRPILFENIFRLVNLDKKIDEANQIHDPYEKSEALGDIAQAFIQINEVDQALKVANTIPCDTTKSWALRKISEAFVRLNEFNKAIDIVSTIPNDNLRRVTLLEVSLDCSKAIAKS